MKKINEFSTLIEAQSYSVLQESLISASIMKSLMLSTGLYSYFVDHTADLQRAAAQELFGGSFDFILTSDDNIISLFDYMANIETDESIKIQLNLLKEKAIARANVSTYPYIDLTIEKFNQYKAAYDNKTIKEVEWNSQKYLRITLNEDLFEPANTVLFFSDDIFINENLGKPKRLYKAGVYIIDLTNVRRKAMLHVNFNINANATCELI